MSSTTTAGIDFPTDRLEQTDKEVLIQIIKHLSCELSGVKDKLSDTREEVADLRGDVKETREDVDQSSKDVADVRGDVKETREDVDRVWKEVANLRGDVEETRDDVDRVWKEVADTNGRVSDLEEEKTDTDDCEASESDSSTDDPNSKSGESTPLEQITSLPEHVADDNLTKNQQRARSVAMNIETYGRSCPAGVSLPFSRLRDVLTAQEDSRAHYQTVRRVAEFLSEFGSDGVDITETRGGKTVVVFREKLVDSLTDVVTSEDTTTASPVLI
jgi:archaellum component FlaC